LIERGCTHQDFGRDVKPAVTNHSRCQVPKEVANSSHLRVRVEFLDFDSPHFGGG
jgi:hypothetical protein